MFEGLLPSFHQCQPPETSYMKKKRLFSEQIRKKDRAKLINQLRKIAQLPDQLMKIVKNLPESIQDLMSMLRSQEILEWEQSIAYLILQNSKFEPKQLLEASNLNQRQLISFFVFLMKKSNEQVSLYNQCYNFILNKSNQWAYPQKIELLWIFIVMLRKGHQFVIPDAQDFISKMNSNRFYDCQIRFYDAILRNFPTSDNINAFLPPRVLSILSQQIGIHFYNDQQKISMMEILIQVLYLSNNTQISKSFYIEQVLSTIEYFFRFYNTSKMLLDRSIILIYNINIDATSYKFVKHNCFSIVSLEMKNRDYPTKIRSLMAQLYLNSIFNYPKQGFYQYLMANLQTIFSNFEFVIDEFGYLNEIKEMSLQLLKAILAASAQEINPQNRGTLSNYIQSNSSFLKTIQMIKGSSELFQEYHIKQTSESL